MFCFSSLEPNIKCIYFCLTGSNCIRYLNWAQSYNLERFRCMPPQTNVCFTLLSIARVDREHVTSIIICIILTRVWESVLWCAINRGLFWFRFEQKLTTKFAFASFPFLPISYHHLLSFERLSRTQCEYFPILSALQICNLDWNMMVEKCFPLKYYSLPSSRRIEKRYTNILKRNCCSVLLCKVEREWKLFDFQLNISSECVELLVSRKGSKSRNGSIKCEPNRPLFRL